MRDRTPDDCTLRKEGVRDLILEIPDQSQRSLNTPFIYTFAAVDLSFPMGLRGRSPCRDLGSSSSTSPPVVPTVLAQTFPLVLKRSSVPFLP